MGPGFSEQETNQLLDSMEPITVSAGEDYAPPAPAPEKLTEKQLRQLRRMWVTKVNGTVKACEHKDNFTKTDKREGKQPNNNCIYCWEAYFMTSVDLDFIHTVLTTKGGKALVAMKGTKFVKMFHGFLATKMLPMLQAEVNKAHAAAEDATGAPPQIVGGTFGTDQGTEISAVGLTQ